MATNHKPQVRGTDQAIWDRLKLVPFDVTIPEADRDKQLRSKLIAEAPGILRWMVQGCLEWQRDGLGVPAEVRDATRDYRADMDVVGAFVSEVCVTGADETVAAKALYTAYKQWCDQAGEKCLSQKRPADRLKERGLSNAGRTTTNAVQWSGIGLRSLYDE